MMNGVLTAVLRQTVGVVLVLAAIVTDPIVIATVAQPAPVKAELVVGVPQERRFGAGQIHSYALQLAAGDFVSAAVTPSLGVEAAVALVAPDGRELVSVEGNDWNGAATLIAVASDSGRHQLRVTSAKEPPAGARYSIVVDAVRPAEPNDALRAAAARKLEAAARLTAQPQPGARQQAGEQLDLARAEFRQAGDRAGEARAVLRSAWNKYALLSPDGLETARLAVTLYRDAGDTLGLADALDVLGLLTLRNGDLAAAQDYLSESVALATTSGQPVFEVKARNALGITYGRTGDAERAVQEFQRALATARVTHSVDLEQYILNNLGIATKDLGDYRRSLETYSQALALSRSRGDRLIEATALNNMGNLYRILGEYQKALECHEKALTIARDIGNQENEARALNTIGLTYSRLGDYQKALDYHERSLALRRQQNDPAAQAASLDGAGLALSKLGNPGKAIDYLNEALRLRRSVAERYAEADSLLHLAHVERDRDNLSAALEDVEASVQLTDSLRGRVVSPDLRASFVAAEQERYELYIDVLMQLDATRPHEGFASRALEASERGRARVLLESLIEARTDIRQGIDPALLASERGYQRKLDEASTRLSQLLGRSSDPQQVSAVRSGIEKLNAEYQRVEARIREESPAYAALTQPRPLTTAEIQRELLDDTTVLLEYRLGDKRSWLWMLTPTDVHSIELPPRKQIDDAARRAYGLLTARQPKSGESPQQRTVRVTAADAKWRHQADALSRMLLGQAAARMGSGWRGKRLVIVAADTLEYLPFSCLPDPLDRSRPLVQGHEIVNVPSASVLSVIRQQADRPRTAAKTLAIFADPVFEADDPRVSGSAGTVASRSASRVRHAEERVKAPKLTRLPFSRQEAAAIAALVPASDRLEATDFRATRALATSGDLAGFRIVHFATHGFLNSEHPGLSGLVLSLVRPDGSAQDGFLRLNDIYNLHLSADVVVLSACQTALGKEIRGEGIVGLTRGFMYAGTPRIVASLWQVDDLATAELMRLFYEGMLAKRLPPAAALRAAQRSLAAQPRWSSPFYWSGFVLQGDWK